MTLICILGFKLASILPGILLNYLLEVLGIDPGTSGILRNCSTTQLYAYLKYLAVLHLNLSCSKNHSHFVSH